MRRRIQEEPAPRPTRRFGTLATDLLDLDALAGDGLDAHNVDGLYRRPLTASPFGTDLDMRVSATKMRIGHINLEDAAFAALARGNRLELTVDEAGAFGGTVKGREVATLGPDEVHRNQIGKLELAKYDRLTN